MIARVAIACPGLGRVHRGYESFAAELHAALRPDPRLDVRLYAGAEAAGAVRVACVPRTSRATRPLRRLAGGRGRYVAEQLSFAASLLPHLRRQRPHVVLVSDYHLARALARLDATVLFSNGGPVPADLLRGFAHVHQVAPGRTAPGVPQTLIPYGVTLGPVAPPAPRPVLLSAGALDVDFKRMDYVIREVARLPPAERPHLVLAGERTEQTPHVEALARELLGAGGCTIRRVEPWGMGELYEAASAFVLASLSEGFGRVLVEAAGRGVPCLAHDHPAARWILGAGGVEDLRAEGALAAALPGLLTSERDPRLARVMHDRFGWEALAPAYADMLLRVASTPRRGRAPRRAPRPAARSPRA